DTLYRFKISTFRKFATFFRYFIMIYRLLPVLSPLAIFVYLSMGTSVNLMYAILYRDHCLVAKVSISNAALTHTVILSLNHMIHSCGLIDARSQAQCCINLAILFIAIF